MRLSSIRIQNFRAFVDEQIEFNDYTCLVGPNGGGKSTVLTALNIFFRETNHAQTDLLKLDKEDFHHGNTDDPIIITVTFEDLNDEAQDDFKDYFRHGKLTVSAKAKWNEEDGFAEVKQYGERLGIEGFKVFFKAEGDGASVAELTQNYVTIRATYAELPAPGTKKAMIDALRGYEAEREDQCVLIESDDQFYGVSKGANRLEKYVQWVFVPAVKDASEEQIEAKKGVLGKLLERTVRAKVNFRETLKSLRDQSSSEYQKILDGQQDTLTQLSNSLNQRLGDWCHPDTSVELKWQNDPQSAIKIAEPLAEVVVGERLFKGRLARFGHGLQRSFILALLEELAGHDATGAPKLILACEEPELYQHPPQARHLAAVLQKLTTRNAQVMTCSHSPYFVSGRQVEDIRSIRTDSTGRRAVCNAVTLAEIADAIADARGEAPVNPPGTLLKVEQALLPALNEVFFTNVLILVEGIEDLAYISTYLTLNDQWDEFRRFGCHIVPAGGKSSLVQPLAIAHGLKIPTFVVIDSDAHKVPAPDDDTTGHRAMHEKDNLTILKLCGINNPDPFPDDTLWHTNVVMWQSEIGREVAEDIGNDNWNLIGDNVRSDHGIDVGDINKNSLFIGYRLLRAWEDGKKSPTLIRLCEAIINFAGAARNGDGSTETSVVAEAVT